MRGGAGSGFLLGGLEKKAQCQTTAYLRAWQAHLNPQNCGSATVSPSSGGRVGEGSKTAEATLQACARRRRCRHASVDPRVIPGAKRKGNHGKGKGCGRGVASGLSLLAAQSALATLLAYGEEQRAGQPGRPAQSAARHEGSAARSKYPEDCHASLVTKRARISKPCY